jgi:hypothetical protein
MRLAGYASLFAAVLFSTTASAQQQPSFFTNALWVMRPAAAPAVEGEPETRTAQVNTFLFEQTMTAALEAVVQSRAELAVPGATRWNRSPATIVFEPGDALVLVGGVRGRALFCDRRISWESQNVLDGRKLRACLIDDNRDGVMDRVMWAGSGEGLFTPMFIQGWLNATSNVAYTARATDNPGLIVAGPVVTRSALGAYRVTFAVRSGGEPHALADLNHRGGEDRPDASGGSFDASGLYFRSGDTPVRVDVMGARIEVVSVERDTVTYRIHSQFDSATPMQIGYGGSMGVDVPAPVTAPAVETPSSGTPPSQAPASEAPAATP